MWDCVGFSWQGFGSGEDCRSGLCRRCQKLPLCPTEPVPDGSKTDLLWAKAELIRDAGSTSVIMYLRRGKKLRCNSSCERGVRICERNNSADTKVRRRGRRSSRRQRRDAPAACGEDQVVPLQSMVEQISTLQLHGGPHHSRASG